MAWDEDNVRTFICFFMQDSFGLLHWHAGTMEKSINGGVIEISKINTHIVRGEK